MRNEPLLIDVPRVIDRMYSVREVRVLTLREVPAVASQVMADEPGKVARYWSDFIAGGPGFNGDVEGFYVLHLNSRRRVISHALVATGTLDTILVHARQVFRVAICANAAAVVLMHNHPSGDATPSEADIRVTRELIKCGDILGIQVLDHVIIGAQEHRSLRELGYFYK